MRLRVCAYPTVYRCIGRQQATHLATRYKTMKRLQLAASLSANTTTADNLGTDSTAASTPARRGSHSTRSTRSAATSANSSSSNTSGNGGSSSRMPPADHFFSTLAGESLVAWFASSDNKLLLNQLRQAGLRCCQEDPGASEV